MYYNGSKNNICDGVVIYVLNSLEHEHFIDEIENVKFLKIVVKLNNLCLNITALYRTHNIQKSKFNDIINNYLSANSNLKNHFMVGDFNMNIIDDGYDNNIFLGHLLSHGFVPLINTITRPNDTSGSCIDNFFAKTSLPCKSIVHQQCFKDHYPIFAIIDSNNIFTNNFNQNSFIDYKKLHSVAVQTN